MIEETRMIHGDVGQFAGIVLRTWMSGELPQSTQLSDFVWLYTEPPFEFDDFWRQELGGIHNEGIRTSNCAIIAPSHDPAVMRQSLYRMVDLHYFALLLFGVGYSYRGFRLAGSVTGGRFRPSSMGDLDSFAQPIKVLPASIDGDVLRDTTPIVNGLARLPGQRWRATPQRQ
jgi:hypothetical protein